MYIKMNTYTFVTENEISSLNLSDISSKKTESGIDIFDKDGKKLGYLSNSVLTGDKPASEIKQELIAVNLFGNFKKSKDKHYLFYHCIVFLKADTCIKSESCFSNSDNNDEYCLLFGGAQAVSIKKRTLIKDLQSSEQEVALSLIDGKLFCFYDGSKAGMFKKDSNGETKIPDIFADVAQVAAIARKVTMDWEDIKDVNETCYEVRIKSNEEFESDLLEFVIQNNANGIEPYDEGLSKIKYLIKQGVSAPVIKTLLNNIGCVNKYSFNEFLRISNETFFQESSNKPLERMIAYIIAGLNIRLVGEKGVGKNTLISTLSWLFNKPIYKIGCSEHTDEYALFGGTQIGQDGSTYYKVAPFAHGLTIGAFCVLDEGNMVPPELLSVINQITDNTKEVDTQGGLLRVSKNTTVILTMNEDYQGTSQMNDATIDRFQGVFLSNNNNFSLLMKKLVPEATDEDISICNILHEKLEKAVKENSLSSAAVTTRGFKDALVVSSMGLLSIKIALVDAIAGRLQDIDDREIVKGLIAGL